jgi:hypothetical protein
MAEVWKSLCHPVGIINVNGTHYVIGALAFHEDCITSLFLHVETSISRAICFGQPTRKPCGTPLYSNHGWVGSIECWRPSYDDVLVIDRDINIDFCRNCTLKLRHDTCRKDPKRWRWGCRQPFCLRACIGTTTIHSFHHSQGCIAITPVLSIALPIEEDLARTTDVATLLRLLECAMPRAADRDASSIIHTWTIHVFICCRVAISQLASTIGGSIVGIEERPLHRAPHHARVIIAHSLGPSVIKSDPLVAADAL